MAAALERLGVSRNPLTDLAGLAGLTALQYLEAETCDLGQLVAVAPGSLVELRLRDDAIVDLTPLAGHLALGQADLRDNSVTSLAPIAQAPWVLAGCAGLSLTGNPPDAMALDGVIPQLCVAENFVRWDLGECSPDGLRCGFSDP